MSTHGEERATKQTPDNMADDIIVMYSAFTGTLAFALARAMYITHKNIVISEFHKPGVSRYLGVETRANALARANVLDFLPRGNV